MISSTHAFLVPKGADDIRMIYTGRSSGLNGTLWDPNLALVTMRNNLRSI